MKKYLFFALAAAGMLSSCTSDDIVSDKNANLDNNELVPIRIGMGQKIQTTRGTGTVGGFDNATDNKWAQQKVNVYMLEKGTMTLANDAENNIAYQNQMFYTPDAAPSGIATPGDNSIKYYNPQGKFDFWGYRLDDAVTEGEPVEGEENITVNFKINGSQDVMVAKAVPTEDELDALENARTPAVASDRDRAYSAFAARHGLQPDLEFRHLLSRLTFQVIPGSASAIDPASPVVVDGIKVVSPDKGTLYIASTGDVAGETQRIEWDAESTDEMTLMQRDGTAEDNLVAFQSVDLSDLSTYVEADNAESGRMLGEALLVAPDVTSYDIIITLHQPSLKSLEAGAEPENIEYTYETKIPAPVVMDPENPENVLTNTFVEGYSYNVKITLWGLTDIQVTTTLDEWKDGGEIELSPEDEERNNEEEETPAPEPEPEPEP